MRESTFWKGLKMERRRVSVVDTVKSLHPHFVIRRIPRKGIDHFHPFTARMCIFVTRIETFQNQVVEKVEAMLRYIFLYILL